MQSTTTRHKYIEPKMHKLYSKQSHASALTNKLLPCNNHFFPCNDQDFHVMTDYWPCMSWLSEVLRELSCCIEQVCRSQCSRCVLLVITLLQARCCDTQELFTHTNPYLSPTTCPLFPSISSNPISFRSTVHTSPFFSPPLSVQLTACFWARSVRPSLPTSGQRGGNHSYLVL